MTLRKVLLCPLYQPFLKIISFYYRTVMSLTIPYRLLMANRRCISMRIVSQDSCKKPADMCVRSVNEQSPLAAPLLILPQSLNF